MISIFWLALWLQMSAPQIRLHCVTEFGCEHSERWGDGGEFSSLFYIQGIASTNGVLSWTSAETPHDTPWENCVVSDAAGNDKPCGAAAETDGKPPKGPLTTKHNHIERGEFVDPVDVPAVQETEDTSDTWWTVPSTVPADVQVKGVQRRWTCADKSRVLLTSEDGKKHCIKF